MAGSDHGTVIPSVFHRPKSPTNGPKRPSFATNPVFRLFDGMKDLTFSPALADQSRQPSVTNSGFIVRHLLKYLSLLLALSLVAACGSGTPTNVVSRENPLYPGIQDGDFFIPPVPPQYLFAANIRTEVDYFGPEGPGEIIVDTFSRRLYYTLGGGRAMRYAIAVGREGIAFHGSGKIGRKQQWPSWQPTRNMIRTRPDMYAAYAAGLPGGLDNPLGARALYLYRGGRDTLFRIHGTIDPASIGRATSAGCIRLFNQDIIDLYDRVEIGTPVHVRTHDESIALEGLWIDDEYGRIAKVPDGMTAEEARANVAERAAKLEPPVVLTDPMGADRLAAQAAGRG